MENKKVLSKIIPAVLVLVLALLLVITISSCSKSKKTPTGAIVDKDDYLKINLADDKSYSVSKLEFYKKLRYVGYDVFEDALFEAALNDYVVKIKEDIEANSSNLSNSKYYKRFKYVIDAEVYGKTDEDEIEDLEDKEKDQKEKTYLNKLKQFGYDINYEKGIYQQASFEYQTIKLAKREYARDMLLKDIEDEDSENKITDKSIEEYFTNKIHNKGDFSALVTLFSSQTEINETLMQLNLKFIGNKLYRVPAANATYKEAEWTFAEYKDYYDDFDNTKEGVSALDDNEVLFELCRVYNYVYSYRTKLTFEINGKNYLDETLYPFNPIEKTNIYSNDDYETIKNCSLDDMVALITSQDLGDIATSPRVNYDYKTVYDIDSTLQQALYNNYLYNSDEKPRYNTPSSTFARGNYLAFKLVDAYEVTYKSVKALAELQDAVSKGDSELVIKGYLETVKEEYKDLLRGLGIINDDAKVKTWALDYATNVEAFGIKGAKEILASTSDKENADSIWSKVFEDLLTDEYINEKINDYLDDECKITIYDQLFEVQFAQKNSFYKAGSKQSKENVLKVKVNDKEYVITAAQLFERLEKKYGATEAISSLSNQILKEKYYSQITDLKKKKYEEEYESILTYFAQGNSTQYGYSPSIGQTAFINLYFRADNKDDAIFNMWVSSELQDILIYKNPNDITSTMLSKLQTLTTTTYNEYANIELNMIHIYTDDDEDGEADDWTLVDDSDARKQEVMELAAELINIINERAMNDYSNSNRDSAYNSILANYQSASRISHLGNYGDGELPTFTTDAEKQSYYYAKFKAKGLFLSQEASKSFEDGKAVNELENDVIENQIINIYNYMIENHSEDLTVDQIIARTLEAGDAGVNIDKVTKDNIFYYDEGFTTFYIINTKKAPTFKFEVTDNADTSTGSKVYPYSINEDDPFPTDDDKKPIDNTGQEDSLYNTSDTLSYNQTLIYVKEFKDGVESLSLDVINAFKAYFDDQIMKKYASATFRYYIFNELIKAYAAEGKITVDSDIQAKMDNLVNAMHESLFEFKTSDISNAWYDTFK